MFNKDKTEDRIIIDEQGKVNRWLANHSLSSTASQGTSNIPFPWFLLLGCNRQARNERQAVVIITITALFSSFSSSRDRWWAGLIASCGSFYPMVSNPASFHFYCWDLILYRYGLIHGCHSLNPTATDRQSLFWTIGHLTGDGTGDDLE